MNGYAIKALGLVIDHLLINALVLLKFTGNKLVLLNIGISFNRVNFNSVALKVCELIYFCKSNYYELDKIREIIWTRNHAYMIKVKVSESLLPLDA